LLEFVRIMSKNSSLKLALCLSGQARSLFQAKKYIQKNLLDPYNVDVFCHTWKPQGGILQMKLFEDINFIYDPIYLAYDMPIPATTNSDMFVPNASHPANFCTSMFYSIYKANDLRIKQQLQNSVKYDFVIRSRFDLALNKVIDFNSLEKGKVYVSKDTDGPNPLLNDQFAIADPDTMNIYASTFLYLRKLHESGVSFCGHEMLQEQLLRNSIPVERIDINHPFVDGRFNIGQHSIIREDMNNWVDLKIWGY
jgi:hypothetical protein